MKKVVDFEIIDAPENIKISMSNEKIDVFSK